MLRRQHVVEQRALVVVGVACALLLAGRMRVQQLGELEHVVGVAGLGTFHLVEHGLEVGQRMEMLPDAVAADGDAAALAHRGPEEARGRQPVLVRRAGVALLGDAGKADHLGDLRIGMQPGQRVARLAQRIEDRAVREALGQAQVTRAAAHRGDVGEDLVHAAVLGAHQVLQLRVAQRLEQGQRPGAQVDQHLARQRLLRQLPRVAQAGEGLVQVVPRHPAPVDGEAVDLELAARDLAPGGLAVGDAAEVAVAMGELALAELAQHLDEPAMHLRVAGGRRHHRQRRHVVPAHVTVQAAALPVAVGRLGLRQAGLAPEGREQPVRIERHQVALVDVLRRLQRAVEQPHLRQRHAGGGRHGLGRVAPCDRGSSVLRGGRRHRAGLGHRIRREQRTEGGTEKRAARAAHRRSGRARDAAGALAQEVAPHQSPARAAQSDTPPLDCAVKVTTKAPALEFHCRDSTPAKVPPAVPLPLSVRLMRLLP